ncbi:MAG: hypothetical protein V4477_03555, partial [Pseudomonadota bacterium]
KGDSQNAIPQLTFQSDHSVGAGHATHRAAYNEGYDYCKKVEHPVRLEWIIHLDRFNDVPEERIDVPSQGDWYWRTLLKNSLLKQSAIIRSKRGCV